MGAFHPRGPGPWGEWSPDLQSKNGDLPLRIVCVAGQTRTWFKTAAILVADTKHHHHLSLTRSTHVSSRSRRIHPYEPATGHSCKNPAWACKSDKPM